MKLNTVDFLLEVIENRYQALAKTDVTISLAEVKMIKKELKYLREENARLSNDLSIYQTSTDDRMDWQ